MASDPLALWGYIGLEKLHVYFATTAYGGAAEMWHSDIKQRPGKSSLTPLRWSWPYPRLANLLLSVRISLNLTDQVEVQIERVGGAMP